MRHKPVLQCDSGIKRTLSSDNAAHRVEPELALQSIFEDNVPPTQEPEHSEQTEPIARSI